MAEMNPKSSRVQRILLVSSLALNFVIIGIVAGMFLLGGPKGPPQRFDLTAGPITRAMDAQQRETMRDALHDSGAFRRGDRAQMRADTVMLLETVRSETFDAALFRDVLDRQRSRLNAGQASVLDALTQQITDMNIQERTAFADRLEEQMRRQPPQREQRNN